MSDCIGCGYCCSKAPCSVGQRLHGDVTPCPELHFAGGRHWCRWVITQELKDDKAGELARLNLCIGVGCTSNFNSWRREDIVDRTEKPNTQQDLFGFMAILQKQMHPSDFGGCPGPQPKLKEDKV